MLGKLNNSEVEDVLKSQIIGHIGCHADGISYIVPVMYVYDGTYIYAHSAKGMKIDMMRKNAEICFEVDIIQNIVNWQSVIAWGKFEEIINSNEKQQTMQKLIDRIVPLLTSETVQPLHGITKHANDAGRRKAILYRIKLNKKTGRFEKR